VARVQSLEVGRGGPGRALKRQNELYRGHVAEVFELRDEVARLREALRQLTEPRSNSKVVPLPAAAPSTASDLDPSIV